MPANPRPKSAPGDFYVVKGECLACGVPQVVAPDLVGWTGEKIPHCCWKKQPETQEELERAIAVLETQELECHRYAGTDPAILRRAAPKIEGIAPELAVDDNSNSATFTPNDKPLTNKVGNVLVRRD